MFDNEVGVHLVFDQRRVSQRLQSLRYSIKSYARIEAGDHLSSNHYALDSTRGLTHVIHDVDAHLYSDYQTLEDATRLTQN